MEDNNGESNGKVMVNHGWEGKADLDGTLDLLSEVNEPPQED